MIDALKRLLAGIGTDISADDAKDARDADALHIAAAALLVEAALIDGAMAPDERARIAILLQRRFSLDHAGAEEILAIAEEKARNAVEIFSFLRPIIDGFDHDARIALLEMLWDVVQSDGVLHDYEANLLRRVTGMLGISDLEAGAARKRVLAAQAAGEAP